MLANYLAAALRNLARNRLHSAITTASLAIGFAAVMFAAIYWRHEHGYDRFWPDQERIYAAVEKVVEESGDRDVDRYVPVDLALVLPAEVPGVEAVGRLAHERFRVLVDLTSYGEETVFWADPGVFETLKVTALAGDPVAALEDPGSVVLGQSHAEKYFGKADPIGRTLTFTTEDRETPQTFTVRVGAVIADLDSQSHLHASALYLSGRSHVSRLADPKAEALTYFRVRPGVRQAALEASFVALTRHHVRPEPSDSKHPRSVNLAPLAIRDVYMAGEFEFNFNADEDDMRTKQAASLRLFGLLALFILAVASVNFITLMTARGAGRAVEVGVRKAAGARRRDLVVQFVGEAVIHAVLAFVAALALTELTLPLVNTLTSRAFRLDYLADTPMLALLFLGAVTVGAVAGLYPALALSSFRPAAVLKGGLAKTPGSARLRQILITVQFTPLVLLALATVTVHFALANSARNGLKVDDPDRLMIGETCTEGLRARIAAVPGVRSAICTEQSGMTITLRAIYEEIGSDRVALGARLGDGREVRLDAAPVDKATLEFRAMKPIAGRFWNSTEEPGVVLTETAARMLGYKHPPSAVGQVLNWKLAGQPVRTAIIGVAADRGGFEGFENAFYYQDPRAKRELVIGVKLDGRDEAATLAAMDKAWAETGAARPLDRHIHRDRIAMQYAGMSRLFGLITACVGVGVVVAVLGLFGLAAFLAEQRTKEIGIRKALGADRRRLMQMLLFQFARPVLIANLIAGSLLFVGVNVLMSGLEPDVRPEPGPEVYLTVIAGSFALAFLATFLHAWRATGARPVAALRYE